METNIYRFAKRKNAAQASICITYSDILYAFISNCSVCLHESQDKPPFFLFPLRPNVFLIIIFNKKLNLKKIKS